MYESPDADASWAIFKSYNDAQPDGFIRSQRYRCHARMLVFDGQPKHCSQRHQRDQLPLAHATDNARLYSWNVPTLQPLGWRSQLLYWADRQRRGNWYPWFVTSDLHHASDSTRRHDRHGLYGRNLARANDP